MHECMFLPNIDVRKEIYVLYLKRNNLRLLFIYKKTDKRAT